MHAWCWKVVPSALWEWETAPVIARAVGRQVLWFSYTCRKAGTFFQQGVYR